MKTTLTSALLILCMITSAFSQKANGSISGSLVEASGEPAPFVTVILLDSDSVIVKTDFSKDNGSFNFPNIGQGEYRVQLSSFQYKAYISKSILIADDQNLNLKPIEVAASIQELEEVTIAATRPLIVVEPDKTVFNVEGSPNATGNDAMELLRKSPGVIIDNNDNIILQGKSGVRILIDGKPTQLRGEDLVAMLRSMQSEQIDALEIITNPSAKYDAEGNAGIINIRLKRDKTLGTNATITTGYGVGEQERYRAAINVNARTKKTNVFGSYNYYDNGGENFVNFLRKQNGFQMESESDIVWKNDGHGFRAGTDYFVNKNHTFGMVFKGNKSDRSIGNDTYTLIGGGTSSISELLVANNLNTNDTDNFNGNLNYQFKGEKGKSLNVDLDYGYFYTAGNAYQPNVYYNGAGTEVLPGRTNIFSNDQITKIDIRTAKADYEVSLGKGKLSTGVKVSDVVTDNTFDYFNQSSGTPVLDINRSSSFEYTERVYAAYATYFTKLNDKVRLNAGVRLESTESKGELMSQVPTNDDLVERNYTDLFPSGGITYQHSKTNQFGVNYSRRIDRPSYQNLNPFEFKLDELTFRKGNPFLTPQYTHNIQATHTYKGKLNTKVSYSVTKAFFAQVTDTTGEKGTLIRQQNIEDAKNLGLNISYPFSVAKWWSAYSSFNLNHVKYQAEIDGALLNLSATTYNIYVQNNFMLPKGFKLELSGWYNSPSIWGGTFVTGNIYSINAGVQKAILNGKGNIKVSVDDIFFTQQWDGKSDFDGLNIIGNGGQDSRRFKVGLTYRLGNQKVKASRRRKTGQDAEQRRIQQGNS